MLKGLEGGKGDEAVQSSEVGGFLTCLGKDRIC